MKEYATEKIRNLAILGHQGSGKTSMSEALLFVSKAIDKKGEVEKKNTVSDYMVEEQAKLTSLSLSVLPLEWKNYKINFLDLPGNDEFVGDLNQALEVVQAAILVIDSTKGVEVGTERVWAELKNKQIPTIVFMNKLDKENIKFEEALNTVISLIGANKAIPFAWPNGLDASFTDYADVVLNKSVAGLDDKVAELREKLVESAAETSEELLELFFSGEELSDDMLKSGIKAGVSQCSIVPIIVGSVTKNIGIDMLLDVACNYVDAPNAKEVHGKSANGDDINKKVSDQEAFSAYVFKTMVDPFLGTINLLKINSGTLKAAQEVVVSNKGDNKKVMNLSAMRGKTQLPCDLFHAGDIAAITKLEGVDTGDTLCDPKAQIIYQPAQIVSPVIYIAVHPKNKNDEDKISQALQRLNQEDPTFEIRRNKETAQLLLGGQGMTHLGYVLERLKTMFKVDVDVEDQKIVYRETIKRKVEAEGKHKKQSGGAGQFGHVWIRFQPSQELFEFDEEVFGGAVPKNYFPAVEKGLVETFEAGPLAGFPVINVKATLYDGSYHPVDSNEISFKLAASLAFKEAVKTAGPTILEPIVKVGVKVKDQFVGDVMGDMNKRRGRVLGMDQEEGFQVVNAEVPEAEIVKYAIDLKAMTQGSGSFTREFLRYEEVPGNLIDKIVEQYKK